MFRVARERKVSELNQLKAKDVSLDDLLLITDTSEKESKSISIRDLIKCMIEKEFDVRRDDR